MTWHVRFAALRSLLVGSDTQARGQSCQPTSAVTYGPALPAYPLPRPVGERLQVRALRLYNRDPKAAAVYLDLHHRMEVHISRIKGVCSNG